METAELIALRKRLAGEEPVVVVEAPAGHGKTEEAVAAAVTVAREQLLEAGRVLFLTHTNAARDTFNRRLGRAKATMKTIHALAEEIVDTYASPLGYPRPLDPLRGEPSFDDMLVRALEILERRPEVGRGLALRYPFILVDEYQDCTQTQHALVQTIASAAPTRLRLFGDALQAIYEFAGDQVDWPTLAAAHPSVALTTPWRWRQHPALALFLVTARASLEAGLPVDLRSAPPCVRVSHFPGVGPEPFKDGHSDECLRLLRTGPRDGIAVLTHYNQHALALRRKLPGLGKFHEGSDIEPAKILLEQAVSAENDAPRLASLLVKAMHNWGIGMTRPYRDQINEICTPSGVVTGGKVKILPFSQLCRRLYERPTVEEWLRCIRAILNDEHGVQGWKLVRPDQFYLLARVRPTMDDDSDPVALLHREARAKDAGQGRPHGGFMTIHKAKGLEFAAVAVPYCSGTLFADDWPSRKRLYVAMTRAQRQLHLIIPKDDPTPLLMT